MQRHRFGDGHAGERLLVGGCRADKDILIRVACKEIDVPLYLIRCESNEVGHCIEVHALYRFLYLVHIVDVALDEFGTAQFRPFAVAPVQDEQFVPFLKSEP